MGQGSDDGKGVSRDTLDETPSGAPSLGRVGPYHLIERIAVGGMAEVFRAHKLGGNETVVIKRMLPGKNELESQEVHAYFQLENAVGQTLRHPNLVRVFEMGQDGVLPYLVLEDVRGLDLWRFLRWSYRTKRLVDTDVALFIAVQVLRGLHAFHGAIGSDGKALNLVHRDVSPSNILLGANGSVKLADYGIARAAERNRETSSHTKGKLGYLSPEQVQGLEATRKSDLFAAATIAAELLMGRHLFSGGSELAVLLAIRDANIQPFLEFSVRLPEGLTATLCAALHRNPDFRPGSADTLAEELAAFIKRPTSTLTLLLQGLVRESLSHRSPSVATMEAVLPTRPAVKFDPDLRPITSDLALEELGLAPDSDKTPVHGRSESGGFGQEVTQDQPALQYRVRTHAGMQLGPFGYAQLVEALATSRIAPTDTVAMGNGPYRRVDEFTELQRHLPLYVLTGRTQEQGEVKGADANYDLEDTGMLEPMVRALLHEDSGLLLCDYNGVRKEVYLEHGVPEFVSSNLAGELLGEYLIAHRVITRAELDMALAVMPRFEGRLGDTLAALGLVDPVTLFRHIASQVREKLMELYLWTKGKAVFYRGVAKPTSGFPLGLDAVSLLVEGIENRMRHDLDDLPRLLRGATHVMLDPRPTRTTSRIRTQLPPSARLLLDELERPKPVDALLNGRGERERQRIRRDLTLLVALQMLKAEQR